MNTPYFCQSISRQRHLPRPGAFFASAFCQSQWFAVALLYVVGACFLGWGSVGIALPDGTLPFGTLPCCTGTSASKAACTGRANYSVAHTLGAGTHADLCR